MYLKRKKVVFLHIPTYDLDSIYNCVHLFILPFLRFTVGKKQLISSIRTKVTVSIYLLPISVSIELKYIMYFFQYNMTSTNLPTDTFEKAELDYEEGDFNVTCFTC